VPIGHLTHLLTRRCRQCEVISVGALGCLPGRAIETTCDTCSATCGTDRDQERQQDADDNDHQQAAPQQMSDLVFALPSLG